jgi:glutamate mutase epsilon subunit
VIRYRYRDMGEHVKAAADSGRLVVQPRMGMSRPDDMSAGIRATAGVEAPSVATITLDSYTRVGDHAAARRALDSDSSLNGFPLVAHGPLVTARVAAAAGSVPVQVRHGSAGPNQIFEVMAAAGLTASEGGPISYCLPYGRKPLAESVAAWKDATATLAELSRAGGRRAHLETFGGCLLGQLCPPSLLVAMSVLEAMFFVEQGIESVSLSYAQQTDSVQDIEALAALRILSDEMLPERVDRHLVLYTYMGVYPRTMNGAQLLQDASVDVAVHGRVERLIVKTAVEAHRIPTVTENITAMNSASEHSEQTTPGGALPWSDEVDCSEILAEARALIGAVLQHGDIGDGLLAAFRTGQLDVPFCLHEDNQGLTQGGIDDTGRLYWAKTGNLPFGPAVRDSEGAITSTNLLSMLNFLGGQCDQLGQASPPTIAVVGSGPRGMAVLERLGARLAAQDDGRPVEIDIIDAVEPGAGRIWRTGQPPWLLMNTPAGEVTLFSGPPDDGPTRPGAGPSLASWWQQQDPAAASPDNYAARGLYGQYLQFVMEVVEHSLPEYVTLNRIHGEVLRLDRAEASAGWHLPLADGRVIEADSVVLATGHPVNELDPAHRRLAAVADSRPNLHYLRGDSAADLSLDALPAGAQVGLLGLGLAFYDIMSLLTEGRGGRYVPDGEGLRYLPSGQEPHLIAGSRSGVPVPARGRNQKDIDHVYEPAIFTSERVAALRAIGKIDFKRQIMPGLMAEVNLMYHRTEIRSRLGQEDADLFVKLAVAAADGSAAPNEAVLREAAHFGADDPDPVDLNAWARPFAGRQFTDRAEYHEAVVALIKDDIIQAEKGNVDGPVKAALDVLRDVRPVIRQAVDLSGLTARSHQHDFIGSFTSISSHLAAGPPVARLRQVLALLNAGVLELIGPGAEFGTDQGLAHFTAWSPLIGQLPVELDAIIDARIPNPDVRRDSSGLVRQLLGNGTITSYVNTDDDFAFDTGGMAVTDAPFRLVDCHGQAIPDLYALGIPTEHTRWFTQVGSSRPGVWGDFMADADSIAAASLAGAMSSAHALRGPAHDLLAAPPHRRAHSLSGSS